MMSASNIHFEMAERSQALNYGGIGAIHLMGQIADAQSPTSLELIRMEFRRFLHLIVLLPAQIVRSGRRIIYRIMGYNEWLKDFFATWEYLRRMAPA
jgi:hypothetical protein